MLDTAEGRRAGVALARVAIVAVAAYFAWLGYALPVDDRDLFALIDARPIWWAAAIFGVAYAVAHRREPLMWAWVIGVTVAALGRSVTLLVVGSDAVDRAREIAGAGSWLIVFLAGQMAALILVAESILTHHRRA